jgi:hypothetical protein
MVEDMVSRYWRVSVVGLGLGFVLGAALFGIMVAAGNPNWRGYLTVADVVRSIAWYGFFGFLVALAACAGGWISVAAFDRRLEKQPGRRVSLAAGGAGAGTIVLGIAVGVLDSLQGFNSWVVLIIGITIALGILSAIVAAVLVTGAEKRRHVVSLKSAKEPVGDRWINF